MCDASHNGLWSVLEQLGREGLRPISFASRYLNAAERKYSTNELKMLAVVRIWGQKISEIVYSEVNSPQLLNGNNKKKTMFSWLTRWIDRIAPFDFMTEHMPGAKVGMADYLSRHPAGEAERISRYDNTLKLAKVTPINKSFDYRSETSPPINKSFDYRSETSRLKANIIRNSIVSDYSLQIQTSIATGWGLHCMWRNDSQSERWYLQIDGRQLEKQENSRSYYWVSNK